MCSHTDTRGPLVHTRHFLTSNIGVFLLNTTSFNMADSGDDEVERICLGFDNLGLLKCKNPAFERTYYCKEHQKSPHGHIHVLYWGIPWLVLGGYLFLADLYDLFIPVPVFITGFILSFGLLFYEMVTRIYHWRIIDKTNQIVPPIITEKVILETKKTATYGSIIGGSTYSRKLTRSRYVEYDDGNDVGDWGSNLGDTMGPSDDEDDDDDG